MSVFRFMHFLITTILARGLNRVVKENYIIIRRNMAFDDIKLILLRHFAKYLVSTGLIFLPFLSGFCEHFNTIIMIIIIMIIICNILQ